jgi:hypothetical protein
MKKLLSVLLFCLLFINACRHADISRQDTTYSHHEVLTPEEVAFLENIASICGQSFSGKQTFIQPGRESWEDKNLVMHIARCDPDSIHIPFHLDQDKSRTWLFVIEEQGLRFRHDHRYDDGSPHEVTLYGGYAQKAGSGFIQRFPADDYTCQNFPTSCNALWEVELAEDLNLFIYRLYNFGELIFEAEFNLRLPI